VSEIGRDLGHNPFELGRGALIERRKPDKGALSVAHVIDLLRCEPRFDLQLIRFRHDLHDDLAGRDHTADGMHRQLMDYPVGRRAQLDPV